MHVSSPHPILEGIRPSLLRMYCRAICYPLEASSSIFSVASQILYQAQHSLPSTSAIPVRYQALCCHLRNWGMSGETVLHEHLRDRSPFVCPVRGRRVHEEQIVASTRAVYPGSGRGGRVKPYSCLVCIQLESSGA